MLSWKAFCGHELPPLPTPNFIGRTAVFGRSPFPFCAIDGTKNRRQLEDVSPVEQHRG